MEEMPFGEEAPPTEEAPPMETMSPQNPDLSCFSMDVNIASGCSGLITGACDEDSVILLNELDSDLDGAFECQTLCFNEKRCNYFTFVPNSEGGDHALKCYLRQSGEPEAYRAGRISGPNVCPSESTPL